MDEVVELQNVDRVCRLCLSANGPRSSVFGAQDSPVSLAAKIQACLAIQISVSDKLSTTICGQCVKNVNQWHNYKESCLKSQAKLHQWVENQLQSTPTVVTIKDEPIDLDFDENNVTINGDRSELQVPNLNSSMDHDLHEDSMNELNRIYDKGQSIPRVNLVTPFEEQPQLEKQPCIVPIKLEPQDDYDTDCATEMESMSNSDMMLNSSSGKADRVMEADSTERMNTSVTSSAKKRGKRGPRTHYRGVKNHKEKCKHCQIYLHSKYSFENHMKRFHNTEYSGVPNITLPEDTEESIEDVEDEVATLENEAPLTQVQENIISQLKTFSCYTCQKTFTNRKATQVHIRQHMPDLRAFTCVACLTQFENQSQYKVHCTSSFECAMKIALVVPKDGEEKYFNCNMCSRSLSDRKELLSHLEVHSQKQYASLSSASRSPPKLVPMAPVPPRIPETVREKSPVQKREIPDPYMNGDPYYNNVCVLCGMIYKRKTNMLKHRDLCLRLAPEVRTSYRCVHCGMTFLVFKKFHFHLTAEHKIKVFTCAKCDMEFASSTDFLNHYETHRRNRFAQAERSNGIETSPGSRSLGDSFGVNTSTDNAPTNKFDCALCDEKFSTKEELIEHRHTHLKVKIYSCVICRRMFSDAATLEAHMKNHGIQDSSGRHSVCVGYKRLDNSFSKAEAMNNSVISDPGESVKICQFCGKKFSNGANARKHENNIHGDVSKPTVCAICSRRFESRTLCAQHVQDDHKQNLKEEHNCPHCSKSFAFPKNLKHHLESAHNAEQEAKHACDICGKAFVEEISMKKHRGWHMRVGGLSPPGVSKKAQIPTKQEDPPAPIPSTERPAKARKSFPNPPPPAPKGNFQCQVCDDKFTDVTDLRKHLWDVHCARSKPEKTLTDDELQCQICTAVFSDKETLKIHVQWHNASPILNDDPPKPTAICETCGKVYASRKGLLKHRKTHLASTLVTTKFPNIMRTTGPTQFMCTICRKVFSSLLSLQRHRVNFHGDTQITPQLEEVVPKEQASLISEPKAKRMKLDTEDDGEDLSPQQSRSRRPVMCHPCKKMFPNMSILYRHKQQVHKLYLQKTRGPPPKPRPPPPADQKEMEGGTLEPITESDGTVTCNLCSKNCAWLGPLRSHFTLKHLKSQQKVESGGILLCCTLCDRHAFTRDAMSHHIRLRHNIEYDAAVDKNYHREVNLATYKPGNIDLPTQDCPHCNIRYPNYRLLKVHYFKFHETAD